MISLNSPPPRLPSSDAIEAAHALIALITNPDSAKANLDALLAAKASLDESTATQAAAAKAAQDAAAGLADLQDLQRNLASREESLIKAQTQLNVASGALLSRDEALKLREATSDRRALELDARAKALEDKLAAYRAALA